MAATELDQEELRAFADRYDTVREDTALTVRGEFMLAFPIEELHRLTLDDYVIGKKTPSFCARVEAKTKAWANIQGATSSKFGIYFGRTKSDPERKYRFTAKFGTTKEEAFGAIKKALLDLIESGKTQDFQQIQENPLSQMFKAKILCLYLPDIYLNVCSAEHIEVMASELGLPPDRLPSEYQHLLLREKQRGAVTRTWSNPKFMSFLYAKFIRRNLAVSSQVAIKKPRRKSHRHVDFEELQAMRTKFGIMSEEFALDWERKRLVGLGLESLAAKIADRRKMPSYGFDFMSFTSHQSERYIEVKTVGFDHKEQCSRFYLSVNEHAVAVSSEQGGSYYFYLVRYGKDGKPKDLIAKTAAEVFSDSELVPCVYAVRFELKEAPDS